MMQKKISVVVPTFKRIELLKKCLHHLASQTLQKQLYEIIVVSDGPDAESQKVCASISAETCLDVCFLSLPHKRGPAAARNLGWQHAKASLIAFTDDDCLPDKNWLQSFCSNYKNETEIAYTGKVIVPVSDAPTDLELNTKQLENGEFVTANCSVPKAVLQKIGGFDEAFAAAWREDSDIHFKLLTQHIKIVKLDDAIIVHPVRKAPWGVSIKEQRKTMYNALLFKKFPLLYRQRIRSKPSWRYYFIVAFFTLFIAAIFLKATWLTAGAFVCWFALTVAFILKRISGSRKTASHILEMIATSVAIPFLSVFWTLYGAIKYRVLFF